MSGNANAANEFASDNISFGFRFASAPATVVEENGGSNANCPGDSDNPGANAGFLCIFRTSDHSNVSASGVQQIDGPDQQGTSLFIHSNGAGNFWDYGTWAATSP